MTDKPIKFIIKFWILLIGTLFLSSELLAAEVRFIDNADGTIKDTMTDLIWIKNSEKIPAATGPMIWVKAKRCCDELIYAGSGPNTWRLPNIKELQTLIDDSSRSPRIDTTYFDVISTAYWSNTDDTGSGMRAWTVNFLNGDLLSLQKLSLLSPVHARVRCVRRD
jgi:hypothetical protein